MLKRFWSWVKRHFRHARSSQQPSVAVKQSATSQASLDNRDIRQDSKNHAATERGPRVDVPPATPPQPEQSPIRETLAITSDASAPTQKQGSARVPTRPERLWDEAYDVLKKEQSELVEAYEKILSSQQEHGIESNGAKTQQNLIDQIDPNRRRQQMKELIDAGLNHTVREARIKERVSTVTDVVLSVKDVVSTAIKAVPQAALAWTSVCVALEVGLF